MMRRRSSFLAASIVVALTMARPLAQQPPPAATPFRSAVNLVLVDVVVRDRSGDVVRNLSANDFELLEDGRPQQIASFGFEDVSRVPMPVKTLDALSGVEAAANGVIDGSRAAVKPAPMTANELAGHRLIVLLFDVSSMQPEDLQQAIDGAVTWTKGSMTPADLVAVATIGTELDVLTDFTSETGRVQNALAALSAGSGMGTTAVDSSTAATDEAAASETADTASATDASAQELDTLNNDVRLRAITTLAQALTPIQQKKAILYFSSGMERNGADNQVELRKAVNAAVRANISIYPVDARGLQAIVPGGSAREGSRGGVGAFSGQNVAQQFGRLAGQQETLQSLASDTGGRAFVDTNDFGEAFTRVVRDISAYYILGFSSTNTLKDGRFRKITVKLKNGAGLKVEAREGYFADRDFAHTGRTDREALLQEQLGAPLPATDVPVFMSSGWFRLTADRYYVPLSIAVPGDAVPATSDKTTLDVAGFIRDERGLPVGRIRDTLTLPATPAGGKKATGQILYQTGVTLPPGRFTARVVVRENANGAMGSFEANVTVPELKKADLKVSSIVLSTQVQPAAAKKTANPLVRDGIELVPNLTHIMSRDQKLYVYYEVYEPQTDAGRPQLATNLAFYRNGVKVLETPSVERDSIDALDRKAALFQFEVAANSLAPGLYTCQINLVDQIAGHAAFPRLQLFVRNSPPVK
jgi:VWFA-related protein